MKQVKLDQKSKSKFQNANVKSKASKVMKSGQSAATVARQEKIKTESNYKPNKHKNSNKPILTKEAFLKKYKSRTGLLLNKVTPIYVTNRNKEKDEEVEDEFLAY